MHWASLLSLRDCILRGSSAERCVLFCLLLAMLLLTASLASERQVVSNFCAQLPRFLRMIFHWAVSHSAIFTNSEANRPTSEVFGRVLLFAVSHASEWQVVSEFCMQLPRFLRIIFHWAFSQSLIIIIAVSDSLIPSEFDCRSRL